jgi:NAD-dependent dihydropyrimidine dehydrogenase PreA subunit
MVDGSPVGMRQLDETFDELAAAGRNPGDSELAQELLERVGRQNYIPPSAQSVYAAALTREYAAHLARANSDDTQQSRQYRPWRGYPREQIAWYPTVDEELCDGCGRCLRLCNTGALGPTDDHKVQVVDVFACIVGCSSCASLCKPGAIIFPPRSILDAYPVVGAKSRR